MRGSGMEVSGARRLKQLVPLARVPHELPSKRNYRWILNSVQDQLMDGRRFRTLTVLAHLHPRRVWLAAHGTDKTSLEHPSVRQELCWRLETISSERQTEVRSRA